MSGLLVQKYLPPNSNIPERLAAAVVAGIASHILCDMPNHKEYMLTGLGLILVVLLEIAAVFIVVFSGHNSRLTNGIIFFGMAGVAFPDVLGLSYEYFFNWRWLGGVAHALHYFHGSMAVGPKLGFVPQILVSFLALLLVKIWSA